MNLAIVDGHPKIELTQDERVILYLSRDHPLPESKEDSRGLPRTPTHMCRRLQIHMPSMQHVLSRLEGSHVAERYAVRIRSERHRAPSHVVYQLTEDGRKLAESIERIRKVKL